MFQFVFSEGGVQYPDTSTSVGIDLATHEGNTLIVDVSNEFELKKQRVEDLADHLFADKPFSGKEFVNSMKDDSDISIARAAMMRWKEDHALDAKGSYLFEILKVVHPLAAKKFKTRLLQVPQ